MKVRNLGRRRLVRLAAAAVLFAATTASSVPGAAGQDADRIYVSYARDLAEMPVDDDFSFEVQIGGVRVADEDFRAVSGVLAVQLVAVAPTSRVVENCPGHGARKAGAVVKLKGISADAAVWVTLSFRSHTGAEGDVVAGGHWPVGFETVSITVCEKLKF